MARLRLLLLALPLLLGSVRCGGGATGPATPSLLERMAQALPGLSSLPVPVVPARHVSSRRFELLDLPPVVQSTLGVAHAPGQVVLDPAATPDGLAWAVFALHGFPPDHAIHPTDFGVASDTGCWVAVSDFGAGEWRFSREAGGDHPHEDGAQLISPAHVHYVALLAVAPSPPTTTVTRLEVSTSADLPLAPVVVLNVPHKLVDGFPGAFSALGSTPGTGTIESVTFHWGDGTPDDVVPDPTQVVTHTYATAGAKSLRVTVRNDQLLLDTGETQVQVAPAMRDLLLVYNADVPADLDLAGYYASPVTGRAVDPAYVLGIHPAVAADPQQITRSNYEATIRDPIKAFLDASTFKDTVKYILLCKGIPHKIPGADQGDGSKSTFSSVDSELCLLYSDGTYPHEGWVWNGPNFDVLDGSGFFLAGDVAFTPRSMGVSTATKTFVLDYLVGRLTAYSYADVKAMIDRSIAADTTGTGSVLFDSSDADIGTPPAPQHTYDTMVDPVWNWTTDDAQKSGAELLSEAGFAVFADDTVLTLTGIPSDGITVPLDRVIGYAGWGRNHAGGSFPSGPYYILRDLRFTYRPGACFMSYESYNGDTFAAANLLDLTQGHPGQGQIADFLHLGGTVAIGNCYEPFIVGVGDERWVFDRYLHHGDRWIEAAYKGLRLLSWQEVVVGDPLCRVR